MDSDPIKSVSPTSIAEPSEQTRVVTDVLIPLPSRTVPADSVSSPNPQRPRTLIDRCGVSPASKLAVLERSISIRS